jgi:Protein of unknown function (DUF2490)
VTAARAARRCAVSAVVALQLAPSAPARADDDAQAWLTLELQRAWTRRWAITAEQHLRFDQDLSRVAQVMPDVSLQAKLGGGAHAIVGYRLQYVRDGDDGDDGFVLRHRWYAGAQGKLDLGELRLTARALVTEQLREDGELRHGERSRVAATWRGLRRWRPQASVEAFVAIADPEALALDKLRLGVELERRRGDAALTLGYRLELADRDDDAARVHAVVLAVGVAL